MLLLRTIAGVLLVSLVGMVGCDRPANRPAAPRPRVVSFSPALTGLLFDLGLGDHVVGVTNYCHLPPGEHRRVVGNFLEIRLEPLLAAEPDVVVMQMERKYLAPFARMRPDVPIEHFTIETLGDIASAMGRLGAICERPEVGQAAEKTFRRRLTALKQRTGEQAKTPVAFVVGIEHPLAAGRETFMDEMIALAGGRNVLHDRVVGWKEPGLEALIAARPAVLLCQCKPAQQTTAKAYWSKLLASSGADVRIVTLPSDDWTLPGEHLAGHAEQLAAILHPSLAESPSTAPAGR
jgi:ABC-type Fe3+-hydroxamate transport system substrate-binding protein